MLEAGDELWRGFTGGRGWGGDGFVMLLAGSMHQSRAFNWSNQTESDIAPYRGASPLGRVPPNHAWRTASIGSTRIQARSMEEKGKLLVSRCPSVKLLYLLLCKLV